MTTFPSPSCDPSDFLSCLVIVDTIIRKLIIYRAIIRIYKMIIILQRDNYPTQVKREKEERRSLLEGSTPEGCSFLKTL